MADEARASAYAPYSSTTVGAALLTKNGKIYTGANIENSSYGATICAERVAIHTAVNAGERDFSAIAIAGGDTDNLAKGDFVPCGICRQVMAEFCGADFVIVTGGSGDIICRELGEILPFAFDKEKLNTGRD